MLGIICGGVSIKFQEKYNCIEMCVSDCNLFKKKCLVKIQKYVSVFVFNLLSL